MKFGVGAGSLAVVVLATLAGCGSPEAGGSGGAVRPESARTTPATVTPTTATPTAEKASLPSAELQGRWWTWAASEPEATNPVADTDGSACARNQPRDVWFLAGTFGGRVERTCEVPEGRPIAFPVINLIAAERRDCAAFMSDVEGTVVLDGKAVEPATHKGESITVRGTRDNPTSVGEGRFTVIGCGVWVQLPAPAPGTHALKIRGRSGDFSVDVDYALTVTAPST